MEIYLDLLLILNTYFTWILLNLTAQTARAELKPINCAAASFIGGLSSLGALLPTTVKLYAFTSIALRLLSLALIIAVAFWRVSLKKSVALAIVFVGYNLLLGGVFYLLRSFFKIPQILLPSGFIYFDVSPIRLVCLTALVYAAVIIFDKIYSRRLGKNASYKVSFRIGCKVYSIDGYADTGNNLRDLFSGLPVIFCTGISLEPGSGFRAVPCKTVSGEGLLYACKPEELTLRDQSGKTYRPAALVSGSGGGGEIKAVFNPSILK